VYKTYASFLKQTLGLVSIKANKAVVFPDGMFMVACGRFVSQRAQAFQFRQVLNMPIAFSPEIIPRNYLPSPTLWRIKPIRFKHIDFELASLNVQVSFVSPKCHHLALDSLCWLTDASAAELPDSGSHAPATCPGFEPGTLVGASMCCCRARLSLILDSCQSQRTQWPPDVHLQH
jgi:hypothetical protein